MLAELMRMKYGVAVAGTHGKTTTTSLVAAVLREAGRDPTVVVGGKLRTLGTNARLGQGEFLVAEADESDGTFLLLSPIIAVVTNIDREHLDYYRDMDRVRDAYLQFIHRVPFYGLAVLCLDNVTVRALVPHIRKRFVTYGTSSSWTTTRTIPRRSAPRCAPRARASAAGSLRRSSPIATRARAISSPSSSRRSTTPTSSS